MSSSDQDTIASRLHENSIVIDAHNDTILRLIEKGPFLTETRGKFDNIGDKNKFLRPPLTFYEDSESSKIDLPKAQKGGINCLIFACWVSPRYSNPLSRLLSYLDTLESEIQNAEGIKLAKDYDDLQNNIKNSQISALVSVESGLPLQENLSVLRMLKKLGITSLSLTHLRRNALGDGSACKSDSHLTRFGREVVNEMNQLGMIIDLAHINRKGFYDALQESSDPVMVSHANVSSLTSHHRNLKDRQLVELAENGGVIGLSFVSNFLQNSEENGDLTASIDELLDNVDYLKDLVGVNHIGIGSDFDGGGELSNLRDISDFPKITEGLVRRGYSSEEIKKILGGNFMRLFEEVLN